MDACSPEVAERISGVIARAMRLPSGFLAAVLAAAWLTCGCSSHADMVTSPSSGAPPASGTCDADKARFAVGLPASDDLLERARVAAGATTARFLRPNQPITTEYFGWRLNLGLNDQNVIRAVNCG